MSSADSSTAAPRMPSTWRLVMAREIRSRGRSTTFLVSTGLTLLLLLAIIVVPTLVGGSTPTYRIGLVGSGGDAIIATAAALADAGDDPAEFETQVYDDVAAAEDAVDDGSIDAALVDGRELVVATAGGFDGSDLQDLLQSAAGARRVEQLVGAQQASEVIAALRSQVLETRVLSGQEAEENGGRAIIAYGGLVLTYMVILTYAMWALTGVTEEKANRVIELLLATARPWELLAGKLLGIGVLGLGQFVVTVVTAIVAIRVTGAFALPAVPTDMVVTLLLWTVLGFAIYLVLAGAAGSLASKTEDAQNAATPISLMAVGSFFLSFVVLDNPQGTVAQVGTFVPFTAPFVVPIRSAFRVLPLWQHLLAVAVTLLTLAVVVRIGGRVYAGGALQFGGRLKWREAFRRAEL